MEFEISDKPDHLPAQEDDAETIKDNFAERNRPSVLTDDYPGRTDFALHIPEEGD